MARARIQKDVDKETENLGEVCLKGATAKWQSDLPEPTLNKVSIDIKKNSLTAIVGPVGCGKVRLLNILLVINTLLINFFPFRYRVLCYKLY